MEKHRLSVSRLSYYWSNNANAGRTIRRASRFFIRLRGLVTTRMHNPTKHLQQYLHTVNQP